jgi:hypothetical protein
MILIAGLFMTAIAYIWMNRLGRLPVTPRVFIANHENVHGMRGGSL